MTNLRKSFSKKIIFSILVLTVGFFNSCDKRQELPEENKGTDGLISERGQADLESLRNTEQELTKLYSCVFEAITPINDPVFPDSNLGRRNDVKAIYYSADDTRTFLFPLLKDKEIINLFLVSEDDNHYILEKINRLAKEDVIDTKISPYITKIFEVADYLSTDVQLSKIRAVLGTDYKIAKEGDVLIIREKTTYPGRLAEVSTGKLYSTCSTAFMSKLTSDYLELFGWDDAYFGVMYDAVAAVHPKPEWCLCINPELILEHLGLAGQDWFYDEDYWASDPTFPEQELPSYNDFFTHFPKDPLTGKWLYGPENIYPIAGGDVLDVWLNYPIEQTRNVCALKVSIALNGAGINIPYIPGPAGTLSGADGKYYFLNARSLSEWMKRTFTTYDEYTPAQYANTNGVHTLINGRRGIIISVYGLGSTGSGHADIYTGSVCSNSSVPSSSCSIGGTVLFWALN